jgi:hypothetical protein
MPNAFANMDFLSQRFSLALRTFLALPIVGTFFMAFSTLAPMARSVGVLDLRRVHGSARYSVPSSPEPITPMSTGTRLLQAATSPLGGPEVISMWMPR